ncbi:energy coupling factor transporter S component ThiW [Clostridium chauvoei]|uniref:Energy coupling factor transporter S component ThiW n=2 Tax=Clostridium chauvoei TaxID=46867 RepID=A0ABD4RGJ7_9CLOT|nr:energy coupling factor transporter S component ThiW [Clostridium chauvoei]ATD55829.1 energy coupling factor transporter S component ThiW [Clostridium chauvoei]ATD56497.1 energy coupling factor transporter S component ThiW [Clostridium chauvoei]MBX7280187.1 energy coupling factor transporter S component ThiW [Clostridium chauvoei]MBX7282703.1 energy coupling factor transporter S component ThiW [Clostridium chauvoei]MBX7285078.1 energy coupling factor transporter S component ThiW [Clostridium
MNKEKNLTKRLALSGIFIAIATVLGTFSIPFFGAKISPIQHFINVLASVTLGPLYGGGCAFITSLLRNILGTGSLLAFPGSMIGAFLAGFIYNKVNKVEGALIGEVIGTGILGAIVAFPIASMILGKEVALFFYVTPFSLSSIFGGLIAYILIKVPAIKKILLEKK